MWRAANCPCSSPRRKRLVLRLQLQSTGVTVLSCFVTLSHSTHQPGIPLDYQERQLLAPWVGWLRVPEVCAMLFARLHPRINLPLASSGLARMQKIMSEHHANQGRPAQASFGKPDGGTKPAWFDSVLTSLRICMSSLPFSRHVRARKVRSGSPTLALVACLPPGWSSPDVMITFD